MQCNGRYEKIAVVRLQMSQVTGTHHPNSHISCPKMAQKETPGVTQILGATLCKIIVEHKGAVQKHTDSPLKS